MSIAGTHNPILEASSNLLAIVETFVDPEKLQALDKNTFRQTIDAAFADYSECLRLQNIAKQDSDDGKYALAAFIDEVVMSSQWTDKSDWMAKTLQWQYFGEHRGGEGFFNRLAEIRQQGSEKVDLLELYYLCLELGFQGMYRVFQTEKLTSLKHDIKLIIERYRGYPDLKLSTVGHETLFTDKKPKFARWKIAAMVFGFMLVVYIALTIAISSSASSTNDQLSQLSNSIKSLSQQQHYNGGGQ